MQLDLSNKDYFEHIGVKAALVLTFKAIFFLVNEVRGLQGNAPINKKQFINALKAL